MNKFMAEGNNDNPTVSVVCRYELTKHFIWQIKNLQKREYFHNVDVEYLFVES